MNKDIQKINTKRKVSQNNPLFHLPYELTNVQQRLIRVMISRIDDKRDTEMKPISFQVKELMRVMGFEGNNARYERVREAIIELMKRVVIIPPKYYPRRKKEVVSHWINEAELFEEEGMITLTMSSFLKPFLLDVKTHFTKYELEEILLFRKEYTIRFYEWIIEWRWKKSKAKDGSWFVPEMSLASIRKELNLSDKDGNVLKYPEWRDLRKRVIQSAVDEINEKSDFLVSWEARKKGRAYEYITFSAEPKYRKAEVKKMKEMTDVAPEEDAKRVFDNMPWNRGKS